GGSRMYILDIRSGEPTQVALTKVMTVEFPLSASAVWQHALTPDGRAMVTGHDNGSVEVWDLSGLEPKRLHGPSPGMTELLEMTPDGRRLAGVGEDLRFRVYEFGGRQPRPAPWELPDHPLGGGWARLAPGARVVTY